MDRSVFVSLFGVASAAFRSARRARRRAGLLGNRAHLAVDEFESRIVPTAYTWNNTNDGKWATAANWTPTGVPGSADSVTFPATLAAAQSITLPASTTTTVTSILFAQTAAGVLVSIVPATGSTLAASTISSTAAASATISSPVALSTGVAVAVSGTAPLTISGVVSGNSGGLLTKSGAGALVLSGVNTFVTGPSVTAGILSISSDANFGGITQALAPMLNGSTATLDVTASFTLHHTINIGSLGGIIQGVNGSGLTVAASNFLQNFGPLTIATDTPNSTVLTVAAPLSLEFPVTLASGRILASGALAVDGTPITVASGAQIEDKVALPFPGKLSISGTGPDGRGALVFDVSGASLPDALTVAANATAGYVGPANGTVTFNGGVLGTAQQLTLGGFTGSTAATWTALGTSSTANFNVSGTPTVQTLNMFSIGSSSAISGGGNVAFNSMISGALTYTGSTTVVNGTGLSLPAGDNRLPTGTSLILGSGTSSSTSLDLSGTASQTLASIVVPATTTASANLTFSVFGSGSLTLNGNLDTQLGPPDHSTAVSYLFDLSRLPKFTFNSPNNVLRIGYQNPTTTESQTSSFSTATLNLSPTSTIVASLLAIGDQGGAGGGGVSTLTLGNKATTLDVGTINVGYGPQSGGVVDYPFGTTGAKVTIRNTDGVSPVTSWLVGDINPSPGAWDFWNSSVDLSPATTDAKVGSLTIGSGAISSGAFDEIGNDSFTLGATPAGSPFTVNNLTIGTISGSVTTSPFSMTVKGTFVLTDGGVVSAGSIVLASDTLSTTSSGIGTTVSGIFQLTNGTLIASSIAKGPQTGPGTANASISWTTGTLQNTAGANLVVSGVPLNITVGGTFDVTAGQTTTLDAASPILGFPTIAKVDSGTLILDASNSVGAILLEAGAVTLGNAAAIPSFADTTVSAGAALHMNGISTSLFLDSKGSVDNGAATPATLTISSTTTHTLAGTVADGGPAPLNLVVSAPLTITGQNTFTGTTTVSGTTLRVTGSDASSAVTVGTSTAAQLQGGTGTTPGTVGSVVVNAGSTLSLAGTSTSTAGILDASDVTFAAGSTFVSEIVAADASPVAGVDFGQLDSSGTLALNGATLTLNGPQATLSPGAAYVLATAATVVGAFTSLPDGSLITLSNGQRLVIRYTNTAVTLNVPANLYVSSTWATGFNAGDTITDATLTNGATAVFGTTAFADFTDAESFIGPGTTIYLNPGNYSEVLATPIPSSFINIQVRGNVAFDSLASTPAGAMQININGNGGQLSVGFDNTNTTFGATILGQGVLSKTGSGTFEITGSVQTVVTLIAGGTLQVDTGGSLTSSIVDDRGTLTFDVSGPVTAPTTIMGNGGVTQIGAGTLFLSPINRYTGPTDVAAGTVKFLNPEPVIAVANGGFDQVPISANSMSVAPSGTSWTFSSGTSGIGSAGISNGNGGASAPPPPSGSQAGYIENDGSISQSLSFAEAGNYVVHFSVAALPSPNGPDPISLLLDGRSFGSVIVPASGSYANYSVPLSVDPTTPGGLGNHTLTFAGGNTVSSMNLTSFVDSVSVSVDNQQAVEVDAGAALDLDGDNESFDTLTGNGLVTSSASGAALTVGVNNGSSTFAGVIQNGSGGSVSFVKAGAGTFTLSGAETYTGPTAVTAGSLIVNGSLNAASAVTVAASGILGGSGFVGSVTSPGIVDPGTPGIPATLTTTNLVLHYSSGAGTLHVDLGSSCDAIASAGSVDVSGASLGIGFASVSPNEQFTIVTAASITGTFNGLPNSGSTVTVGGQPFQIVYNPTSIVLIAEMPAGLSLVSTVLNGGLPYIDNTLASNQHSMVENVVYSFSQAVTLSAANFALSGIAGATIVPTVNVSGSGSVWTVTFSGAGVNAGTHSIGDGEYELVLSDAVDGLATSTFDFFRLLGDMDGDGTVSAADFSTLISTFLRSASDPLYLGADDLDADGTIGASDLSQFTASFLHSLPNTNLLN